MLMRAPAPPCMENVSVGDLRQRGCIETKQGHAKEPICITGQRPCKVFQLLQYLELEDNNFALLRCQGGAFQYERCGDLVLLSGKYLYTTWLTNKGWDGRM